MSIYGGIWINGPTIDGVERDLTLLHSRMKEREDAIGWNSTRIERRIMFRPYDEYQFCIQPNQMLFLTFTFVITTRASA